MLLSNKPDLIAALTPTNKTRLNDENMLDIINIVNQGIRYPIIDSMWTTQLTSNGNPDKQGEYLERIRQVILTVTDNSPSPLIFLPLFVEEHWSLLVLIRRSPVLFHYFHIDCAEPEHTEYCQSVILRLQPILGATQPFVLPKKVSQQPGDWECGHFVLMNIRMLLDLGCSNDFAYENNLRQHLFDNMMSCSKRNLSAFADDMVNILQLM